MSRSLQDKGKTIQNQNRQTNPTPLNLKQNNCYNWIEQNLYINENFRLACLLLAIGFYIGCLKKIKNIFRRFYIGYFKKLDILKLSLYRHQNPF